MRKIVWLVCAGLSHVIYSFTLTNNLTPVGPTTLASPIPDTACVDSGVCVLAQDNPYMCVTNSTTGDVTTVIPGGSVDSTAYGNAYYFGADLRYGGCGSSNTYIGFLGMSLSDYDSPTNPTFSGNPGIHITINDLAVNSSSGSITGAVAYTLIEPNILAAPAPNSGTWSFVGVNLSGLEFSAIINPYNIPNLSSADSSTSFTDVPNTQAFLNQGMNTIRVPVSWAYLYWNSQGTAATDSVPPTGTPYPTSTSAPATQAFNAYYTDYVAPLLETLTSSGVYTIVDLHTYFHYPIYGSQYSGCSSTTILTAENPPNCPDGTLDVNVYDYEAVWGSLLSAMQADPNINMDYILLDLVNEPVVPVDQGNAVLDVELDLINYLRAGNSIVGFTPFTGYILVEGNNYTGLHSWTTEIAYTDTTTSTSYTNAQLFTAAAFSNAGIDTSNILINVHQYLDYNYSGTQSNCLQDLTTTGPNGFNLDAFVDYLNINQLNAIVTEFGAGTDATSCQPTMTGFLQYLQANSAHVLPYGFVGWTAWSTGHGWGGTSSSYNLLITPSTTCDPSVTSCYQGEVLAEFL